MEVLSGVYILIYDCDHCVIYIYMVSINTFDNILVGYMLLKILLFL